MPPPPAPAPSLAALLATAREKWVKKLIDPSRNNGLLFFRDLKVSMLDLPVESPCLTKLLAGDPVTIRELAAGGCKNGDKRLIASSLDAVRRKALSNKEEKGIDTLQLALGLATWPALDGGKPYQAPVLLIPLRISARGQGGLDPEVEVCGEPQINPVLLHVLREDYGVHCDVEALLEECGREDEEGRWRIDQAQVSKGFAKAVGQSVHEFSVGARAVMANFLFARMPMVEDLKRNGVAMEASALIAAVAGHAPTLEELRRASQTMDEGLRLDARPAREEYFVLLSDSSQQQAIELAEQGRHLVIQGPPGTGKSQTIANLIAQCVAQGKSVLFVAEKRAALDAVIKRLADKGVGLGHLVLDLHGAAISRKSVMERLKRTLDWVRHPGAQAANEELLARFEERRRALNEHAHRVNRKHAPLNLSYVEVLGALLRLPKEAQTKLRVPGSAFETYQGERLRELRDGIEAVAADPELALGTSGSAWTQARLADGASAQRALDLVRNLLETIGEPAMAGPQAGEAGFAKAQPAEQGVGAMGFSPRVGGSEEGGPHGSNLPEYDSHGSKPHGSNLHDSSTQRFAPHALGFDPLHASTQAPSLTMLLARWTKESGGRAPRTLAELASACALMRETDAITERYDWGLFEEDLEDLKNALVPATRGLGARLWAFVSNGSYRRARRTLRTLRSGSSGGKADVRTLHAEVCEAADLDRRWGQELNCEVRELASRAELLQVHERLSSTHAELRGLVPAIPEDNKSLESLHAVLRALEADRNTAFRIPGVRQLQKLLIDAGLGTFLTEARTPLPGVTLRQRFERLIHETQLERIYAQEPALTNFKGPAHEQLIEEFRRLDAERLSLAATRVRLKHARMAIDAMNTYSAEADIVQREASKRARHMPLRKLLEQAPHVLTRVAPCWVASPLSVSQLMAPKAELFDVVIFDEGSQIPPEDAIPALYRAKQVVAAGDQHQMPPTSFFAGSTEEEELAEEELEAGSQGTVQPAAAPDATEGFESLLASLESFLPNRMLEWHYRSEDERLITFSNAEIYDNRLVTFPSARADQAIRHVHVAHDPALAGQQESASREVERVVELVLEHARTRSHESLGVIALSIKHANRLEAAVAKAVQAEPALGPFFDLEREERFFVKNLERVQGDERDAIILSIGHGKSPDGSLPMRFGPLLVEGGYRRLNVAITRAKRRMTLVSSFLPHDIDLKRTSARGVALLKAYLEYAVNGGTRFVGTERADEIPLNAFESDIRSALEARGLNLRGQFGASRFRIDLVAMHPERSGQPILAIECDGASYHSGATARDRDRIRQMQLERLGWIFHRIWSTDWFQNREREIARALQAYEQAVRRSNEGAQPAPMAGQAAVNTAGNIATDMPADIAEGAAMARPAPEIVMERAPSAPAPARPRGLKPHIPEFRNIDEYSQAQLHAVFAWIASDGVNRMDEEILTEAKEALGFARMGSRIRTRLMVELTVWKVRRG